MAQVNDPPPSVVADPAEGGDTETAAAFEVAARGFAGRLSDP